MVCGIGHVQSFVVLALDALGHTRMYTLGVRPLAPAFRLHFESEPIFTFCAYGEKLRRVIRKGTRERGNR